jgi:hypothetical protein
MQFVVKAAPRTTDTTRSYTFDEKTMWHGKDVAVGDTIFVFASDHEGGRGLIARGIVTAVTPGIRNRVSIRVKRTGTARRRLGRNELRAYRELTDDKPQTEIARKLYRQATNKIAGVSDRAAKYLATFF